MLDLPETVYASKRFKTNSNPGDKSILGQIKKVPIYINLILSLLFKAKAAIYYMWDRRLSCLS